MKKVLIVAVLVCMSILVAQAASSAMVLDPTCGWTLNSDYDALTNTAHIQLDVDNIEQLLSSPCLNKRWGEIDLGGGAKIVDLLLGVDADPQINLSFAVVAGATDTTFEISSALLTFPTIDPAKGLASAGITVTDLDGNGVKATGLIGKGKLYRAIYNGNMVFADLIAGPVPKGSFDSKTASETYPGGGAYADMGAVWSMQSMFKFTLTANDSASTTSVYRVVPEPSGLLAILSGLTAMAGLVIRKKRA